MREQAILQPGHATLNVSRAGQPYQPANGTEGECFFEAWCSNCARDSTMSEAVDMEDCADGEVCELIGLSMAFKPGDPEYPEAWQYDDRGQPCCTAFVPIGQPIPHPPCAHTMELALEDTEKNDAK